MKRNMKKYLNIAALALVVLSTLSLGSCKNEIDEIFDDDAVARLAKSQAEYVDILTSNGGKWQLEYYANSDEPGYVYLMTFSTDGSVVVSGMNKWINIIDNPSAMGSTAAFGTATSLWDVITDNGPVLTFNSYNKYFHLFADPYDIPGGSTGQVDSEDENESGYGHQGDYEFCLMKYSGDTLYLTGKKRGINMIMTRVSSSVDDRVYMNEVTAMADSFFHAKIPQVYINLPNDVRWIVKNGATGILKIFREDADEISTAENYNVIITHDGLSFMNPITLDGYTIQNFVRQPDGSLLCRDDNQTTMTADPLSDVMASPRFVWKLLQGNATGVYAQLLSQIVNEIKAYNSSTLQDVVYSYNQTANIMAITFNVKRRTVTYKPTYYLTPNVIDDTHIKFTMAPEGDTWAASFEAQCPSIREFATQMGSMTFELSANSLLAPVVMTLTDGSDSMVWNISEMI